MQGADGVLEISSTVERQRGSRWGLAYLVARWHRATSASRIQDFLPLEDSKPSQSPGGWQKSAKGHASLSAGGVLAAK
jgi:hypothetical protein